MIIRNFNAQHFLQNYWQKKPCVIKQFIADFVDPIDENDLAGLAQEEDVDCRIVSKKQIQKAKQQVEEWQVAQGPFKSFEAHCQGDWSLLVQGVDCYIPEIDELAKQVNFIPNWRFDDVMVSYSVANAGVGAHTDEYDVFIIQGKGSRRWQVGLPVNDSSKVLIPHPLLKQIEGFEAIIDEVLAPGDAVYIPPKHPHNGTALEECMNYSVGFRASTNLEVLTGLLDECDELGQVQKRYCDPNIESLRTLDTPLAEISKNELDQVKQDIFDLLNSEQAEHALLQYLSRQALPDLGEPEQYALKEIAVLFEEEGVITKVPGVRPIYVQATTNNDLFSFYIDGNLFEAPAHFSPQIRELLNSDNYQLLLDALVSTSQQEAFTVLVTQLINAGYWEISG